MPVGTNTEGITFEECSKKCIQNEECHSFAYGGVKKMCALKGQKLTASSPIRSKNSKWFTAYKDGKCGKSMFNVYYLLCHHYYGVNVKEYSFITEL